MPVPAIVAAIGALIGNAILEAFVESALSEPAKGGFNVTKAETAISTGFMSNISKNVFSSLTNEEPNKNVGMEDAGLLDIVNEVVRATAYASTILPAEVVEELFMELIQEGFSNAIQMSVGGAFQSILNVWRGGFPVNPDEIEGLAENVDKIEEGLLGLLIAMGGCNVPTTTFRVARGFDAYVDRQHMVTSEQARSCVERINRSLAIPYEVVDNIVASELHDYISLIKECWIKAQNIIERSAERALSRLNELRAELETIEGWIELQEQNQEYNIIDAMTAYLTAIEDEAEADATMASYESLRKSVEAVLEGIEADPSQLLSKMEELLFAQAGHYNSIIEKCKIDVGNEAQRLINALRIVQAYRSAVDGKSDTSTSVNVEVSEVGLPPTPPPPPPPPPPPQPPPQLPPPLFLEVSYEVEEPERTVNMVPLVNVEVEEPERIIIMVPSIIIEIT